MLSESGGQSTDSYASINRKEIYGQYRNAYCFLSYGLSSVYIGYSFRVNTINSFLDHVLQKNRKN